MPPYASLHMVSLVSMRAGASLIFTQHTIKWQAKSVRQTLRLLVKQLGGVCSYLKLNPNKPPQTRSVLWTTPVTVVWVGTHLAAPRHATKSGRTDRLRADCKHGLLASNSVQPADARSGICEWSRHICGSGTSSARRTLWSCPPRSQCLPERRRAELDRPRAHLSPRSQRSQRSPGSYDRLCHRHIECPSNDSGAGLTCF